MKAEIGFPPNSTFYCPGLLYTLDIAINRCGYWYFFFSFNELVVWVNIWGGGYLFFFFGFLFLL